VKKILRINVKTTQIHCLEMDELEDKVNILIYLILKYPSIYRARDCTKFTEGKHHLLFHIFY